MCNLDDLIEHENENTCLDFKAEQYKKEKHEDLIKDVIAMANADTRNDRYIIIGVKHSPSGDRNVLGIDKKEFIDAAVYQQLIAENIDGELKFEYYSYEFEGKTLGIFKIYNCLDRPYLMKKDFKSLKKGDGFIRKGSQQSRMDRKDLDRIYKNKSKAEDFKKFVQIGFSDCDFCREIELTTVGQIELPSQIQAKRIKEIIKEKKQQQHTQSGLYTDIFRKTKLELKKLAYLTNNMFGDIPLEERSVAELEEFLKRIEEIYDEDDKYVFYELNSHKINISILNEGHSYIEDASAKLKISRIEGLYIADRVYRKPENSSSIIPNLNLLTQEPINYPDVNYSDNSIIIFQLLGNIKHHIPRNIFDTPIRIVLSDNLVGKIINLECRILGKNLPEPLIYDFKIKAISRGNN